MTTLTKRTAEELTDYLREIGINVQYLHSEIDAIERVEILRALRKGEFDVLVGINLLREGLDLPEVSLVAILDADKEGFLRSATSLIQTAGRAARHLHGEVILYADVMTQSIQKFLAVSEYRRKKQLAYNEEHHITPRSVSRAVEESLSSHHANARAGPRASWRESGVDIDINETIKELEEEMLGGGEQPGVREGGAAARPDSRAEAGDRWQRTGEVRHEAAGELRQIRQASDLHGPQSPPPRAGALLSRSIQ